MYNTADWKASTLDESSPSENTKKAEETPSTTRSSHDLFAGDLFGDELMDDIYNSTVNDGHNDHESECKSAARWQSLTSEPFCSKRYF
jgi:hypothetical protein